VRGVGKRNIPIESQVIGSARWKIVSFRVEQERKTRRKVSCPHPPGSKINTQYLTLQGGGGCSSNNIEHS